MAKRGMRNDMKSGKLFIDLKFKQLDYGYCFEGTFMSCPNFLPPNFDWKQPRLCEYSSSIPVKQLNNAIAASLTFEF